MGALGALYGFVRAGWTGGLTDDVERALGRKPRSLAEWVRAHASAWT